MKFNILLAPLVGLIVLAASGAGAATLEGQIFEERIRLVNRELRLNGLGVRAVFIIKGYVAGLYLNEKAAMLQDVAAMPGPKRLQLRMLRSAGPDDFNSALVAGIRKNSNEAELARLNERIGQLERTIEAIGLTVAGDVINLDYVPDLGATLAVNGVSKGKAIEGADFFYCRARHFCRGQPRGCPAQTRAAGPVTRANGAHPMLATTTETISDCQRN